MKSKKGIVNTAVLVGVLVFGILGYVNRNEPVGVVPKGEGNTITWLNYSDMTVEQQHKMDESDPDWNGKYGI